MGEKRMLQEQQIESVEINIVAEWQGDQLPEEGFGGSKTR